MKILLLATKRRACWGLTDHAALFRTLLQEYDARWYGPGHEEYSADKPLADVLKLHLPWQPDFIFHDESGALPGWSDQPIVPDIKLATIPSGVLIQDACHCASQKATFAQTNNFDCVIMGCKALMQKWGLYERISLPLIYMPHSIPSHIFKDYGLEKRFDVALYGTVGHSWYAHRRRLFRLLQSTNLKLVTVPHPGRALYSTCSTDHTESAGNTWQEEELARIINSAWLSVAAATLGIVPVAKYYEIPACRTYPIGDLPDEARPFFEGKMLELKPQLSDKEIICKIKDALSDKKQLQIKIDEAYQNVMQNHTTQARIRQLFEQLDRMVL